MKVRSIISAIFVLAVTILYFFGFCKWDIWVYLLSIACVILFMVATMKQQKNYNNLIDKIENCKELAVKDK